MKNIRGQCKDFALEWVDGVKATILSIWGIIALVGGSYILKIYLFK